MLDQNLYIELGAFSTDGSPITISGSVAENNLTYSATNAIPKNRTVNIVLPPPGYNQSLYITDDSKIEVLVGTVFRDPGYLPAATVYTYNSLNSLSSVNTSIPATFNLIYVHKDGYNITSMLKREVKIVNPPLNFSPILLSASGNINVVAGRPYVDPGFPSGTTVYGTVDTAIPGPVTLLYTYKDPNTSIISSAERIVTVVQPPNSYAPIQLNYPTEINVAAGFPYKDPGFPYGVTISGVVDTSAAGISYDLTYTLIKDDITSSIKRKINVLTVNNYTPLTVFGPNIMKVTRNYNFIDPGFETGLSVYSTVDTTKNGTYIIYYTKTSARTLISSNIITNSTERTVIVNEPPPGYVNPLNINTLGISQNMTIMLGVPYTHPTNLATGTIVYGSVLHNTLGNYNLTYTYTFNDITTSFIRNISVIDGNQAYYARTEELIDIARDPVTTISRIIPSAVYTASFILDLNSLLFDSGILVPKQVDILEQIHKKGILPNSFIYLVGTDNNYAEIEVIKSSTTNSTITLAYSGITVTEINEEKGMEILAKQLKVDLNKSVSVIPIAQNVGSTMSKVSVSSISSGVINSLSDGSQDVAINLFMSKIKLKSATNTNWYTASGPNFISMGVHVKRGLAKLFDKDIQLNNLLGSAASSSVFLDLAKIEAKMSNPNDEFYTKLFSKQQLKEVLEAVYDKGSSVLAIDGNSSKFNFKGGDSITCVTRFTDGDTIALNTDRWLISLQQL